MSKAPLALAGLNPEQRKAAEHMQGPALILAGAGSGKTKALTHRIAYMMDQGVQPWQILAVTFTNKAATEMKDRIKNLLHIMDGQDPVEAIATSYRVNGPWPHAAFTGQREATSSRLPVMGTFHSICARILRRDIEKLGRSRTFVIYDSDDQEKLMRQVLRDLKIDEKALKPRAALGYIGRFKCEALSSKEAAMQATTPRLLQVIQAFERYQKLLLEANAVDFDDLILETVRLFHELPAVLDRYQETWRYLHVDEYQDTNHAQYLFISLLAQKYRNLCVIGDPDQSIYSFRGADIRNILEFEKEYPDALRVKLEQNYRSTQPVLTAANAIIKANPNRPDKEMWTERKEGPTIIVHEVRDEKTEAEEAVKAAIALKKEQQIRLNEQVILYRTNAQSRLFEEACMREGIPYRIIGGVKFYARKEVKDVLAYLYVILNTADTLSLLRILNVPSRKIGTTTLEHLQVCARTQKLSLWSALQHAGGIPELHEGVKERILQFTRMIEQLQSLAQGFVVSQLTEHLLNVISMEKWLKDDTDEGNERWQNVQELLSVMHKYDALDPQTSLVSFLEEVALVSEVDKLTQMQDDALTLMTLHLCKGLEFESVFIGGCEEGIFPHSSSALDKEQLEEERRLMYVGMTRAKTHLRLLFTRSRMLWGTTQANAPSRFLDDLPDEVIERRSDELLSAFAWATESGRAKAGMLPGDEKIASPGLSRVEPYRQQSGLNVEFNQDVFSGDENINQDQGFSEGDRVHHPSFGAGKIVARRGDVATIQFDTGQKKSFALSIAPLKML
ncbi:MAG: DNA helicase II / ATP-dependent DNA helicase PcrA [Candidatus Peregrinibacteria bacterium Greene0416_19]|nr:MAG: DNA helicase II / ATP-dependent DNA helicase PcrA [Candidatus Peregrinibacteria bacterium Greene0416_19]